MNTDVWIEYFLSNRHRFQGMELPPHGSELPDEIRLPLMRSLAVFQLGETGGGTRLMRYVREVVHRDDLAGYEEAVGLFIAEEHSHAHILEKLLCYLGGQPLQKQWTNSVFRSLRTCISLEFNIQTLLIAELIAEVYYGLLYRKCPDPRVRLCCQKILSDEMRHIAFHTEFLQERLAAKPVWWRTLWRAQFWVLHRLAVSLVAFDHRDCFHALQTGPLEVLSMAGRTCDRFLRRLHKRQRLWRPVVQEHRQPALVKV